MLLDNQVDFVKSDLLDGLIEKQKRKEKLQDKKKSRERRRRSQSRDESGSESSDSSMSEERIQELEKALTPLEKERLAIK